MHPGAAQSTPEEKVRVMARSADGYVKAEMQKLRDEGRAQAVFTHGDLAYIVGDEKASVAKVDVVVDLEVRDDGPIGFHVRAGDGVIVEVRKASLAQIMGLQVGDELLSVDDEPVSLLSQDYLDELNAKGADAPPAGPHSIVNLRRLRCKVWTAVDSLHHAMRDKVKIERGRQLDEFRWALETERTTKETELARSKTAKETAAVAKIQAVVRARSDIYELKAQLNLARVRAQDATLTADPKTLLVEHSDLVDGVYELLKGRWANGYPVWRKRLGSYFLFSTPSCRWYIGDVEEEQLGFSRDSGLVCNRSMHNGILPYDLPDNGWSKYYPFEDVWTLDADLRVRLPSPHELRSLAATKIQSKFRGNGTRKPKKLERQMREKLEKAPKMLLLMGSRQHEGIYTLVPDKLSSDWPLWKRAGLVSWLFSLPSGKWTVVEDTSGRATFNHNAGKLVTKEPHRGLYPDALPPQAWMRFDAQVDRWCHDEAIDITVQGSKQQAAATKIQHRFRVVLLRKALRISREAPTQLLVACSGVCDGVYDIVRSVSANGYPVWRQFLAASTLWLYSSPQSRWIIWDESHEDEVNDDRLTPMSFKADSGAVATATRHDGRLPHELPPGRWVSFPHDIPQHAPDTLDPIYGPLPQEASCWHSCTSTVVRLPHPAVPSVLNISSNGQGVGNYKLEPAMTLNGLPVWRRKGRDQWIFSGIAGRWFIGLNTEMSARFHPSSISAGTKDRHCGDLPHTVAANGWLRYDEDFGIWGDSSFRVTGLDLEEHASVVLQASYRGMAARAKRRAEAASRKPSVALQEDLSPSSPEGAEEIEGQQQADGGRQVDAADSAHGVVQETTTAIQQEGSATSPQQNIEEGSANEAAHGPLNDADFTGDAPDFSQGTLEEGVSANSAPAAQQTVAVDSTQEVAEEPAVQREQLSPKTTVSDAA
eukprot:TRINITY_DN58627_c0_g1_i1.p1 TRINITY_DN58627_c0_g1~~TRINITY_DN58627_c0_g1_i1.p1  ORF type:complete len:933 (-),score=158.27 TRINITY_DN58627_c0_g1_i1:605-3403(-)